MAEEAGKSKGRVLREQSSPSNDPSAVDLIKVSIALTGRVADENAQLFLVLPVDRGSFDQLGGNLLSALLILRLEVTDDCAVKESSQLVSLARCSACSLDHGEDV